VRDGAVLRGRFHGRDADEYVADVKSPLERRQGLIGEAGRKAEGHTAKRLGARLVRGSGSGRLKGDMFTGTAHLEQKTTQRASFSIKLDWLLKITRTALEQAKFPALLVTFTSGDGMARTGGRWVMIPEDVFNEFLREKEDR
jgi:hypothetical protein